jgi:hypothetical protein
MSIRLLNYIPPRQIAKGDHYNLPKRTPFVLEG